MDTINNLNKLVRNIILNKVLNTICSEVGWCLGSSTELIHLYKDDDLCSVCETKEGFVIGRTKSSVICP